MTELKKDVKRLPILLLGLLVLAIGIYLTKLSLYGLAPWSIFHEGLSILSGLSFGLVTQIIGAIILLFSMLFFRTKVGFGTVLNILLVGPIIDLLDSFHVSQPSNHDGQLLIFVIGFVLTTAGRSLYISSNLGQGPRDGFFVGLSRTFHLQVKYVKLGIEFIVLVFGVLMGGTFGIGTVITVLFSGYFIQLFFYLFHYDPHTVRQNSLLSYFR